VGPAAAPPDEESEGEGGEGEGAEDAGAIQPVPRNSTSFQAWITARLGTLYRDYERAAGAAPGAGVVARAEAAALRYYQLLPVAYLNVPGICPPGCRGLMLFHDPGMGKTRVAAAAVLSSPRPAVVLTPRALRSNFERTLAMLAAAFGRPVPPVAYVSLDAYNMARQLEKATGLGSVQKGGKEKSGAVLAGGLAGKLLVVDEAHNLSRAIVVGGPGDPADKNARQFYDMAMAAPDLRVLLMTGTPLAKDPFELVPLANLCAGEEVLPADYETFSRLYVDRERGLVRNRSRLANRLVGLVSWASLRLPTEPSRAPTELAARLTRSALRASPRVGSPLGGQETMRDALSPEASASRSEATAVGMGRADGEQAAARRPRDDGWFPEVLPTRVERLEMTAPQYRRYLDARSREEAESSPSGPLGQGPREPRRVALQLPGSARATSTYNVRSRGVSNFMPPDGLFAEDPWALPAGAFTREASPKMWRAADIVEQAGGPGIVYSGFVVMGVAPLARYLEGRGYARWNPAAAMAAWRAAHRRGDRSKPIAEVPASSAAASEDRPEELVADIPDVVETTKETHSGTSPTGGAALPEQGGARSAKPRSAKPRSAKPLSAKPLSAAEMRAAALARLERERADGRAQVDAALATVGIGPAAAGPGGGPAAAGPSPGRAPPGPRPARRYAMIYGEVPLEERDAIRELFNSPANARGELLKAVLLSQASAEGLDLHFGRFAVLLEPYWDRSRARQVIMRVVRVGSHDGLPRADRDVQPYELIATANEAVRAELTRAALAARAEPGADPADGADPEAALAARGSARAVLERESVDERLARVAERRDRVCEEFRGLLREVAVECALFGYGRCHACAPTGEPLFTGDPAGDARAPDPCRPPAARAVRARRVRFRGREFRVRRDPGLPLGWEVLVPGGGALVAADPGDPDVVALAAALAKSGAAA